MKKRRKKAVWKNITAIFMLLCVLILGTETQVHAFTLWSKENGIYVNDKGAAIPRATKKGIDVSSHQGIIDWNLVKASDVEFVIIRCGWGQDMEKQDDENWQRNVEECERLGIPYGVYFFSYADNIEKAQGEARHILRLLQGHHPSYPVYYDLEDNSYTHNVTPAQYAEIAKTFCTALEKAGYQTGIYSGKYWFETKLTDSYFNTKEKWVAQYSSACTYAGTYGMWQATDKGRVPGINGDVDVNFLIEKAPVRVNLKAASASYNRQKLVWGKAPGATGYEIYRATSGGKYSKIKTTAGNSLTVSAVTGQNYYYKVRGFKNVNGGVIYGDFSPVRKVKSTLSNPALKPAKRTSSKKVTLSWKKVSGASGYTVYYSKKKGSGYKKLATIKKGSASSCKVNVKKGKRYYYKVKAYRKASGVTSYSSYSNIKSCK